MYTHTHTSSLLPRAHRARGVLPSYRYRVGSTTCYQNGVLDKKELIDALKGMFPVEPQSTEEAISSQWDCWDSDGNGTIGEPLACRVS